MRYCGEQSRGRAFLAVARPAVAPRRSGSFGAPLCLVADVGREDESVDKFVAAGNPPLTVGLPPSHRRAVGPVIRHCVPASEELPVASHLCAATRIDGTGSAIQAGLPSSNAQSRQRLLA